MAPLGIMVRCQAVMLGALYAISATFMWTLMTAEISQGPQMNLGCEHPEDDDCLTDDGWSLVTPVPCPPRCRCTQVHVDCAGAGLLVMPPAADCPPDATTMDLSGNLLAVFQTRVLMEHRHLRELNLSNNEISIIEEAGRVTFPQLQTLDLSGNPLPCGCPVSHLMSSLKKGGRLITDQEAEHCVHNSDLPPLPCAEQYMACSPGPPHQVVHYSLITPLPFSSAACLALCFRHGYSHYSTEGERRCLCGSPAREESRACLKACAGDGRGPACPKSLLQDLHHVQVTVSLSAPGHSSLLRPVEFHAEASINVARFVWEFQDGGPPVIITSDGGISHKFSRPGQHRVTVRAEGREPAAGTAVTVDVPVRMAELHCPSAVQTGHSVEAWLQADRGTGLRAVYSVRPPDGRLLTDDSSCPRGGSVFSDNLRCYWLNQARVSMSDAQSRCSSIPGGKLAYITSADQLRFIQEAFSSQSPVWVNISQTLREADGSQQDCLRLPLKAGEAYQRGPCMEKAPSICEGRAGEHLGDAPVYLVGVSVIQHADIEDAPLTLSLERSQGDIEALVFPGLWFSHSGSLLSMDLGIQPIKRKLLVRIQVLRPFCSPDQYLLPPGCEVLWSPFATCHTQPQCNTTGDCPSGKQWCPLRETCLEPSHPCSTYISYSYPHPPRFTGIAPSYSPVAEVLLKLSPRVKERNIQVDLSHLSHFVHPDDILSIQHNGDRGSLLRCTSSSDSPWRQSYATITHQEWMEDSLHLGSATWVDDVVCDLRVLYGSELRSLVVSSLLNGFHEDGTYTVSAFLSNSISSAVATCQVMVLSPVTDLKLVHPTPVHDCLHVVTQNPALVVISARSSSPAHVQWSTGMQSGETFLQPTCPSNVASSLSVCTTPAIDVGFAGVWLSLDQPQTTTLTMQVTNEVSAANLAIQIQSHDPIHGLQIYSDGPDHLILNQTRVYTANVSGGSSVTFTWTIDNKDKFSYTGASYTMTFRTPGLYRLKVVAQNPISSQEEEKILQVEGSLAPPEAKLIVSSTMPLVSELQTMVLSLQVERSSEVVISWDFGDGSPLQNRSLCAPQNLHKTEGSLVTMNATITHKYTKEGHYQLTVVAYTSGAEIRRSLQFKVVHLLSSLILEVKDPILEVNQETLFSAVCLPSTFVVSVTWNFGDISKIEGNGDFKIRHVYGVPGKYNVTATAMNGRSHATGSLIVTVEQRVQGLQVLSNGPSELGEETTISCSLNQGSNVIYSFTMGDGISLFNQSGSSVTHTYTEDGNFTVRVTATNSLSSISSSVVVHIYRIQVTNIFPDIVASHTDTQFTAGLTMPLALLRFLWYFRDGSRPISVQGEPSVWHRFVAAGNYTIKLLVSGQKASNIHTQVITVEDKISMAVISASTIFSNVSQAILFHALVQPPPDQVHLYWYQWEFGLGMVIGNTSSPEISWTYSSEGLYEVTLTVWNQVSHYKAQCYVTVQQPILLVTISHNGGGNVISSGSEITFYASISPNTNTDLLWEFGDSSHLGFGQNASHTFNQPGNITVTIQAKNKVSLSRNSTTFYIQDPIKTLSLTTDHVVAKTNQIVNFLTSVSSGNEVEYRWSTCKSCPFVTGPSNVSKVFSDPGIYTIRVTVKNLVSSANAVAMVEVQEPVEGVTIHQEGQHVEGYAGLGEPLTLIAHVSQGSNLTFRWVLWPGPQKSNNSSVLLYPTELGRLLAEVWVENAVGVGHGQARLYVLERIQAVTLEKINSYVSLGTPVNISVHVKSGSELQYTWHLGDDVTVLTNQNNLVTLIFQSSGFKNISVTVSNALSSITVSTVLTVQETVSNLSIVVDDLYNSQAVLSNQTICLHGSTKSGSELKWKWRLSGMNQEFSYTTQKATHIFTEPGQYLLELQAWNSIDNLSASRILIVEDALSGFKVSTDGNISCLGQEVKFCPSVHRGSNVSFVLTVPQLNISLTISKNCSQLYFPIYGVFDVLAIAYNQVSRASYNLTVQILENIKGLNISGLHSAWPLNKTMHLTAWLESGQHTDNFLWTFKQDELPEYTTTGQSIEFTCLKLGTLNVLLNISKPACYLSFTSSVMIQSPVTKVALQSSSKDIFQNQCITFVAFVSDGSDLHFQWTFEDDHQNFTGLERSVKHCYSQEGEFETLISSFNLVSRVYAKTTIRVKSLTCQPPQIEIFEPPAFLYRAVGGTFESTVNFRGCTKYRAVYLWQLYKGPGCHDYPVSVPKLDISKSCFTVPRNTLDIGTYCLLFSVTLEGTPLSNIVKHVFEVKHTSLVAQISGGSRITWSVDADLSLDGGDSYDPDLDEEQSENEMEYVWRAEPLDPKAASCILPHLPGLPRISVIWSPLCANNSFIFTLTVRKFGRESGIAKQMVSLISGPVLTPSIRCMSCQPSNMIRHGGPVILHGECANCNNALFTWSAIDSTGHPLGLDTYTTITEPSRTELVIPRGVLKDHLDYTFTLRVAHQRESIWGESLINLIPNKPPIGGNCSLLPEGTILWLESSLEYNCTGWRDPDSGTQLFYSLSVGICSATGCQRFPLYHGLKNRHRARPPLGDKVGEIHVYLEVEDLYGARTLAVNCTLSVSMPPLTHGTSMTGWLWNHCEATLEQMQVLGDTPSMIQLALEVVTALSLGDYKTKEDHNYYRQMINNVTRTVSSIQVSSLWEVAAVSSALTKCVVVQKEVDSPVWLHVLNATEKMIHVLSEKEERGPMPDMDIPKNILTILGRALISSVSDDLSLAALKLTRALTIALGKTRTRGEETLILGVPGIQTQVTRVPIKHQRCSNSSSTCSTSKIYYLPPSASSAPELLQLTTKLEVNPFSGGLPANITMSSQLVALEFTSLSGHPEPIEDLPEDLAIQLTLPIIKMVALSPTSAFIPPRGSARFTLTTSLGLKDAGMHLHISAALRNGSDLSLEEFPNLVISYGPLQSPNNSDVPRVHTMNFPLTEEAAQNMTLLLHNTWSEPNVPMELQVNISSLLSNNAINVSISLFSSLCQYLHVPSLTWRTEGMSPSNASQPHQAVCLAQHLTLFGASLFVPPHRLIWLPPAPYQWTQALICCFVLLSLYVLLMLISHKLDHLDISRVGTVPLCGPQGQCRYWVLVKTGWRRGAGTTAHVGICIYGLNKSGPRHLNGRGGLATGSMEMFQVETNSNLGEIWKIRIWHDNTGLDPSWFLQYVAVWDKQTDFVYFFLLNDWLSVENERHGGRVEAEILATCPQELHSFSQVFPQQLFLGFTDWHLWLSVWWRPARSRFTHTQRVTCCALVLHLYMTICSLWYGAVGIQMDSYYLGLQSLVTWESIFIGILVSVMVLPVQLLFAFLFRETRSLVFVEDPSASSPDVEHDLPMDASSLLSLPGKADSLLDVSSLSCASVSSSKFTFDLEKDGSLFAERSKPIWISSSETLYDAYYDIPLESGLGFTQPLCKEKEKDQLGFFSACSSEDDPLSLSEGSSSSPHLTLSEENLIQSIAADTQILKFSGESDSGRFSPRLDLCTPSTQSGYSPTSESEDYYMTGRWSETLALYDSRRRSFSCISEGSSNEFELQDCCDNPLASPSPFTTRIGVQWKPLGWLFPPRMLWVVYTMAFMLIAGCASVTVIYTSSLSEHGFFIWLISSTCALISSAFLLEPLKVVLLSLYNARYSPPVLSEGMGLVEEPLIKKITDHCDKVRAPGGFSLLQAKEEARRVRALRSMIQSCTGYMIFFLLVLLMNFQIGLHDKNIRLLHSAIKNSLIGTTETSTLSSPDGFRHWFGRTLPSHLYGDQRLALLSSPRLCQLNSLPFSWFGWSALDSLHGSRNTPSPINQRHVELCTNSTMQSCSTLDSKNGIQKTCFELGDTEEKASKNILDPNDVNWIQKSILQVEITQYHKDVHLYVSTIILLDFSSFGRWTFSMTILPFHFEDPQDGLNLSMALALSIMLAALCFLSLELAAMVGVFTSGSSYSPRYVRLWLGLVSAATGLVHLVRAQLAHNLMEQHNAKGATFISLYDVALLSRAQVVLSATLLFLIMFKFAQQLHFVRRWAVFGRTFQKLRKELSGLVLPISILVMVLSCIGLIIGLLLPAHGISFNTSLLHALWCGPGLWSILKGVPGLGWIGLSVLVVGRALLCGSVLSAYRCTRAESCPHALEPQDHEMIDFLVKRFKLWLGVNKVKEYRHSVKFQGLESRSSRPSTTSSNLRSKTVQSNRSPSVDQEDPASPASPGPPLSPALAVEHLPSAITALLDRMDKVNVVLQEVSCLEQRLQIWQIKQQSMKFLHKETATSNRDKQLLVPTVQSALPESALTRIKSKIVKSNSYRSSRWGVPLSSGVTRHAASAGMCSRTQATTRRPQSQEISGGRKRSEEVIRPFPLKRRAWDSEKPGDVALQSKSDES